MTTSCPPTPSPAPSGPPARDRVGRLRPVFLAALVVVSSWGSACRDAPSVSEPVDRPNIVLILSDDQGWSDYGFMGSTAVRTPNLDDLAAEGFRFSLAFNTGNICRPSLRSILTGYHPAQYEARIDSLRAARGAGIRPPYIRHIETLPRLLATRGYASFQGGKYWEGDPRDAGFSEGTATANAARVARAAGGASSGTSSDDDGSAHALGRFADDPLFRSAGGDSLELGRSTMGPVFDFIDGHLDTPFFVWFAPLLPHRPFDASEADRAPFVAAGLPETAIGYYANIARLDRRVGELLTHLEARDLLDRTLVVFLSDNGWEVGAPGDPQQSIMGGARGKSSIRETAFRTPLILRWPARIRPAVDESHLVSTVDLFTTLLDFAGVEPPADRWGESLAPLVTGSGGFDRRRVMGEVARLRTPPGGQFPYVEDQHAYFLRTPKWRFVRIEERDADALYSMRSDPGETQNRCAENPRVCDALRRELAEWRAAMHARPPVPPPGDRR